MAKILEISEVSQNANSLTIHPSQAASFLEVCKPKQFSSCMIRGPANENPEFWRLLHASLVDGAQVELSAAAPALEKTLQMSGFTNVVLGAHMSFIKP